MTDLPETASVIIDADGNPTSGLPDVPARPLSPADQVSAPDKVMRIGTMIKQLLDEVHTAPLDERSRQRLREVHERSIKELSEGLSPELRDELARLALPFTEDETPSDAELRIAQAQLVGWLEGIFHGIQAAVVTQQLAARAQLEAGRGRELPTVATEAGSGQYL